METVFSFVDTIRDFPNKLQRLEDIIADILKQTVECMIFVREYTGHGFACTYQSFYMVLSALMECAARVVGQIFSNVDQTIQDLSDQLTMLKQSFDTGIAIHNMFVSTRMSEKVETLGPYGAPVVATFLCSCE
jgi:hypothetical protein